MIDIISMQDYELDAYLKMIIKEKRSGNFDQNTEKIMIRVMSEINKRQGIELQKIISKP